MTVIEQDQSNPSSEEEPREVYLRSLLPIVRFIDGTEERFDPEIVAKTLEKKYKVNGNNAIEITTTITRKVISQHPKNRLDEHALSPEEKYIYEESKKINSALINELIIEQLVQRKLIVYTMPLIKTSQGTEEEFDCNKIAKSLIIETGMDKILAQKIAKKMKYRLLRKRLEFVSAPLIRELLMDIITDLGLEKNRKLYTRIGKPVYEFGRLYNDTTLTLEEKKKIMWKDTEKEFLALTK